MQNADNGQYGELLSNRQPVDVVHIVNLGNGIDISPVGLCNIPQGFRTDDMGEDLGLSRRRRLFWLCLFLNRLFNRFPLRAPLDLII